MSMKRQTAFNWEKQEKILMEPFEYVQKMPCRHYKMIIVAFNHWLQVPDEKCIAIQEAMQAWISWNILIDDIEDNSPFRYGMPSAHEVFGVSLTINSANKALLLTQDKIIELGHPMALKLFLKRTKSNIHGQGIDAYWQQNFICPTEEAHIEMTKYKIGSYVLLPLELLQLFSNIETDFSGLALKLGTYYALVDDYYNLFDQKALPKLTDKKLNNYKPCSDISEGKITLPIIHAMQFPDIADELSDILKQRSSDPKLKNRAISLLKKHGSDEYMRNKMKTLRREIQTEIDQLGGNPIITIIMDELRFDTQDL